MKKRYIETDLIRNWYKTWDFNNTFKPNYKNKKSYCIVIPPPNITGKLHMGHAFQCTLMDILIRYYRMNQYSVLWKVGADHAGIATQILIEQNFKKFKILNSLNYIKKWKKNSIKNISSQIKTMGCSVDWNTFRFTLDKHFSYAVNTAFIKLYNDGLIYKNNTLVNWDMSLKTAISDLEVLYKEEFVNLYFIKYLNVNNNNKNIIVATTRPETIFADVALAFNPSDDRYKDFHNEKFFIPLINRVIPVIYDDCVDKNFGTGCLKVTPCHDFNDFKLSKKHNLPLINILSKNGLLNENVPLKYKNLSLQEARKNIENDLKFFNFIYKIDNYKTKIPIGDRSGALIEPFFAEQWYVKVDPLIKPVKNIIEKDIVLIRPSKWKKIFYDWIENIKDWCISRQIWWGHRIPAWYDKNNKIYVGESEKKIRNLYKLPNDFSLFRENDVLDTWFSSALWPFASLGWPNKTKEFNKFYPTNTLVTGFDIIFFWTIRMMMFGLKFTGVAPFKEIYVHGLIRDSYGNKMSKTKGNVLDPDDIIYGITYNELIKKQTSNLFNDKFEEKIYLNIKKQFPDGIKSFGADALRLTFTSLATDSLSIKLNIENINKYKNFCNKIWNAANFIIINNSFNDDKFIFYNIFNIWIYSVWQKTKFLVILNIKKRKFSFLSEILYNFFWNDFCNWYLEIIKIVITNKIYKQYLIKNMIFIFNEFLKILHPIAPYITEDIFFNINKINHLLIISEYPKFNKKLVNLRVEKKISLFKDIISKIRHLKTFSKNNFIKISISFINFNDLFFFEQIKNISLKLSKIKNIYIVINNNNNSDFSFSKNIIFFLKY